MSLNEALHWRYAAKRMTGEKLSEANIDAILKAAQYAPTSMGLQPFSLLLISNKELVEKIKPIAFNQPQISEASHLLLFAAYCTLTEKHIDDYLQNIMHTRGVDAESLALFKAAMLRFREGKSGEEIKHWAANQAFLALGFAIAEAALIGVDATPMEGFDALALDDLLGFPSQQLHSVSILALGFRDEANDFLVGQKKVRRHLDLLLKRLD